jgi:excisionase family DNA binding protein
MNATKKMYSVKEVADLLGVSRVTVFRWIKSGKLKATMVGGAFVVSVEDLPHHLLGGLSEDRKIEIKTAVTRALKEYGETFHALALE